MLAVEFFVHDLYFTIPWPLAASLGITLLAILAGIAWAVSRRQ